MPGLSVQFLPARQGDAIWIRWGDRYQIMIDMGTEQVGGQIRDRLASVPADQRRFELLVVTHVDRDHIGGVLTCVADPDTSLPGLEFGDVWFNGWEHLHGRAVAEPKSRSAIETMGPAQGERLTKWLRGQRWNHAFDRRPVQRSETDLPRIELADGLALTILGPTPERLAAFQATWQEEVEEALRKGRLDEVSPGLEPTGDIERYGSSRPPILESVHDLAELADTKYVPDPSYANGCSITFILEWDGRRILFTGDALAEEVTAALDLIDNGNPIDLDLVKVPHHGSKNNVTDDLVRAVNCPHWLFSTDGTRHRHPDAVAIARILRSSRPGNPTLCFNVPSTYNEWWNNREWMSRFSYSVDYGTDSEGLTKDWLPA